MTTMAFSPRSPTHLRRLYSRKFAGKGRVRPLSRVAVDWENAMSEHDHSRHQPQPTGSFWTSRAGIVLIAFVAVAGLLLVYEHRIQLLTGNGTLLARAPQSR